MMVPDVDAACKRFEDLGVEFVKKPSDGMLFITKMKKEYINCFIFCHCYGYFVYFLFLQY